MTRTGNTYILYVTIVYTMYIILFYIIFIEIKLHIIIYQINREAIENKKIIVRFRLSVYSTLTLATPYY